MLHRLLFPLCLVVLGTPAARANDRLVGLLTPAGREQLNALIQPRQVELRRHRSVPKGFTVPGGTLVTGRGFLVAPGRVVTASAIVEGWPRDEEDVIEIQGLDKAWRPAAVGLIDARTGLAVLDVALPAPGEAVMAEKGALWPGRRVYAAGPSWPVELLVQARGAGDLRWYWRLAGPPLPPGTPIFDAVGNLISVVGLLGAGGVPLALPEESIADLRAREGDWLP